MGERMVLHYLPRSLGILFAIVLVNAPFNLRAQTYGVQAQGARALVAMPWSTKQPDGTVADQDTWYLYVALQANRYGYELDDENGKPLTGTDFEFCVSVVAWTSTYGQIHDPNGIGRADIGQDAWAENAASIVVYEAPSRFADPSLYEMMGNLKSSCIPGSDTGPIGTDIIHTDHPGESLFVTVNDRVAQGNYAAQYDPKVNGAYTVYVRRRD